VKDFDIIIAGDFRLTGGTSTAIVSEIAAYRSAGLSMALLPLYAHFFSDDQPVHADIQKIKDALSIPTLTSGAPGCRCVLLLLHNPVVLQNAPLDRIDLVSKSRIIVAHHPPLSPSGGLNYDPWKIHARVCDAYGSPAVWAPVSPVCRESFRKLAFDLPMLSADWLNILDVESWGAARRGPANRKISLGRHSRSDPLKWPETREQVLAAYPDAEDIDVHLLGGDPTGWLNLPTMPSNWHSYSFGTISPREFLRSIDFFVYFHHREWIEAFGRAIAEAIACGCVALLPHYLRATFGPAAIYCRPEEVAGIVRRLHADGAAFGRQSIAGHNVVKTQFCSDKLLRLCLSTMETPVLDEGILAFSRTPAGWLARNRAWLRAKIGGRLARLGLMARR
jgi:hypothetical protein